MIPGLSALAAATHLSVIPGSIEPTVGSHSPVWSEPVDLTTRRVSEILGLKGEGADTRQLAAAVERGLPRSALVRTVARAGLTGKARDGLMYRVVPLATLKRRTRLKTHESEKTERLARVIALAELLWDEQAAAQEFLNAPHPELEGRTPLDCAGSELGARRVEDLVMRALYGLPV
jgi:putative toxin-antitoxin system antitoxin component (TIGR02293 family)